MSWYTIAEAVTLGPSAEAWQGRIDAEEVSSYVDSRGRVMVWITHTPSTRASAWHFEPELVPIWKDVASLRREVVDLRKRRARPSPEYVAPLALRILKEPAPEPVFEIEPFAPEEPALEEAPPVESPYAAPLALRIVSQPEAESAQEPAAILKLVAHTWPGSDRELERRAELPKAFLAKAKKGLRNGPRSAGSWARLEAFMRKAA